MTEESAHKSIREQLLMAGIAEINQFGLPNFSVRRIATACGVSCAAPYKHFKDRQSFIAAIIQYVNNQWGARQQKIIERFPQDLRRQLVEISLDYIRFLVENPHFRSIIMLKDKEFDAAYQKLRGKLTDLSRKLIERYCESICMPEEAAVRKTYVVRSLIYGAALMFDNGELAYNDTNIEFVRYSIDREFDLP